MLLTAKCSDAEMKDASAKDSKSAAKSSNSGNSSQSDLSIGAQFLLHMARMASEVVTLNIGDAKCERE